MGLASKLSAERHASQSGIDASSATSLAASREMPFPQAENQLISVGPTKPRDQLTSDAFKGYVGASHKLPPEGLHSVAATRQNQVGQPTFEDTNKLKNLLESCISEKGLEKFYPPGDPVLDQIAQRAASQIPKLAEQWKISSEIAADLVKLALYDVILYVDDSGSMSSEENGERIDDLKLIISRVASVTAVLDDDGIQVRFMNSEVQANGITSEQQVTQLILDTKFSGMTPMGRELQNKVLGPLVSGPARRGPAAQTSTCHYDHPWSPNG